MEKKRHLAEVKRKSKFSTRGIFFIFLFLIFIICIQTALTIDRERDHMIDSMISEKIALAELTATSVGAAEVYVPAHKINIVKKVSEPEDIVYCRIVKPNGQISISNIEKERGKYIRDPAITTLETIVKDDVYNGESIKVVITPSTHAYTIWVGFSLKNVYSAVWAMIRDSMVIAVSVIAMTFLVYFGLTSINREVSEAKEFTDNIIKSMLDTLIVVNPKRIITRVNKAVSDLLGYKEEELIGKSVDMIIPKSTQEEIFNGSKNVKDIEMRYLTKDKREVPMSFSSSVMAEQGEPIGIVCVAKDLSEIKNLIKELRDTQDSLIQSEKLAALGRLSADIAHEINNPLSGVKNCLYILSDSVSKNEKQYLELAEKEVDRIANIVQGLLDLYRPKKEIVAPINVNVPINELLAVMKNQLVNCDVSIIKDFDTKLPLVMASSEYLKQVFLNIILNAMEAMPEGGELAIRTYPQIGLTGKTDEIQIEFTDTGCGLPEENMDKIFDPFFTTKKSGGTGLGLSVSYGIIQRYNGRIDVESEVGKGTTFIISLPICKG